MSVRRETDLLAIDVGSSRVKFGWFPAPTDCSLKADDAADSPLAIVGATLPEPADQFVCQHHGVSEAEFCATAIPWLGPLADAAPQVRLASVNAAGTQVVAEALAAAGLTAAEPLARADLPIELHVTEPQRAGIDRLLGAVAANHLRPPGAAIVVLDLGTACTVDLIDKSGVFQGGAILPGMMMAADAMHRGTATLPLLSVEELQVPADGVGRSTVEAMSSGIHWGLIGGLRELVERVAGTTDVPSHVLVTGGDAPRVLHDLRQRMPSIRHVPHLVLAGIVIASEDRV